MNEQSVSKEIAGKTITLSSGFYAKQASGSVYASLGDTEVLGVATMSRNKSNLNFFPLSVDYVEKFYAGGKIPGSYNRREGKPSDHEVLVSRLIDRPIRPLFADGFRNEVQIIINVLGIDRINPSDVLGITAASAALSISNIPFKKPIAGVRVGYVNDEIVINPTYEEMENSKLDLIVAGTEIAITMIEGSASELSEEIVLQAVDKAHFHIKELIELQKELVTLVGKEKVEVALFQHDENLVKTLRDKYFEDLNQALQNSDKQEREQAVGKVYEQAQSEVEGIEEDLQGQISGIIHDFESEIVRTMILKEERRPDGRKLDELRAIDCRANVLKSSHGSSVFTRGQTQSLGVVALGSPRDKQKIDLTHSTQNKSFFLHYNFPPFSVGETGRMGATGRREIGHGMLAERSLQQVMPSEEEFDFTVRLVSEILESNGSSSMATICSGSMALMDAGVPIKSHVAGIAMGLILGEDKSYRVLTDIQGLEDHLGDMDFKVAGTRDGITGFQLDIKVEGITLEIMEKALSQALKARMDILSLMENAISSPAPSKHNAPKRTVVKIPVDKIKNLIGMGGKNIKAIVEESACDIDIKDTGDVSVFATSGDALDKALHLIDMYTGTPKVGTAYDGTIKRIVPFGAFVEIYDGVDGLCHISEFGSGFVKDLSEIVAEGDKLKVKVKSVDNQGKISLTTKIDD